MTTTTKPVVTVTRKMRGELSAENEFPMSEPGRVLVICTGKRTGGIVTHASSQKIEPSSNGFTCRSFELFGDYGKTLLQATGRATEKAIAQQHRQALDNLLEATMAEAEAFYVAKAEKHAKDHESVVRSAHPLTSLKS